MLRSLLTILTGSVMLAAGAQAPVVTIPDRVRQLDRSRSRELSLTIQGGYPTRDVTALAREADLVVEGVIDRTMTRLSRDEQSVETVLDVTVGRVLLHNRKAIPVPTEGIKWLKVVQVGGDIELDGILVKVRDSDLSPFEAGRRLVLFLSRDRDEPEGTFRILDGPSGVFAVRDRQVFSLLAQPSAHPYEGVDIETLVAAFAPEARTGGLPSLHPQALSSADIAALHRAVLDVVMRDPLAADIDATQRLGLLYLEGHLVRGDRPTGCGLLQLAFMTAKFRYYERHPITAAAERLANEHCSSTVEQAMSWLACWQFGQTEPQTVELAPGYWIVLGPKSVRIESPHGTFTQNRASNLTCFRQIVLTRYSRVDPSAGEKVPPRHLIESATWLSHLQDGQPVRQLQWFVEEVEGDTFNPVAMEELLKEPGSAWPAPDLPPELQDGVIFRMDRSGQVEYEIGGRFQRQGWLH